MSLSLENLNCQCSCIKSNKFKLLLTILSGVQFGSKDTSYSDLQPCWYLSFFSANEWFFNELLTLFESGNKFPRVFLKQCLCWSVYFSKSLIHPYFSSGSLG